MKVKVFTINRQKIRKVDVTVHTVKRKEEKTMLERVKEIIEEQLNLDGVEITAETRFKEDLEADSLDLFELVMAFEEEYGVEIPSEDLEKITTVGAVIEYIESHQ